MEKKKSQVEFLHWGAAKFAFVPEKEGQEGERRSAASQPFSALCGVWDDPAYEG